MAGNNPFGIDPEDFDRFAREAGDGLRAVGVLRRDDRHHADAHVEGAFHLELFDPAEPFVIERGERIAQLIIQEVRQADFRVVDSLDDSDRGAGGFGHSGSH